MACFGEVNNARAHQFVELQRGVSVDYRIAVHPLFKGLPVNAVSDPKNLKRVRNGLATTGIDKCRLVRQGDHRPRHMQMTDVYGQILWFNHRGSEMDHIEVLRHAQKVTKRFMCASPSSVFQIRVVRRAADGGKDQVVITYLEPSVF